jgi:hypothetical protein
LLRFEFDIVERAGDAAPALSDHLLELDRLRQRET